MHDNCQVVKSMDFWCPTCIRITLMYLSSIDWDDGERKSWLKCLKVGIMLHFFLQLFTKLCENKTDLKEAARCEGESIQEGW